MLVHFRIFIWLLCMELQWGCQTNSRNSYSKYDFKNVHMGPPSGAVIEAIGSMHICRERVSTVQKNSLHQASFRHPLPLPILYSSIKSQAIFCHFKLVLFMRSPTSNQLKVAPPNCSQTCA